MKSLELKVPPLALWAACAVATAALAHFVSAANVPFPGHRLLAIAALAAGIAVAAAGVAEFRRARTTVNPMAPARASSMVTSGVYRFTRNPMYLGMALALAGIAAWWASVAGLAVAGAFCGYMTRFQIRPEERALRERFGEEFAAYAARVRRWV